MRKYQSIPWLERTYRSDNEYGIPVLDSRMQATAVEQPVVMWGDVARREPMLGTYAFYCYDYKFQALVMRPEQMVQTGCKTVCEINFSTGEEYPRAQVLRDVMVKRWIARYWQEHGIRIFVDVNVAAPFIEDNFLGVPKGWKAYMCRNHKEMSVGLREKFERCCQQAESKDVLFVVVGGGRRTAEECRAQHWIWIPERQAVAHGREISAI